MSPTIQFQPDFSDYLIYGLSTHLKDYKLCWNINRALNISLTRYPDLIVKTKTKMGYTIYVCEEAFEQIDMYLIANFSEHIPWFVKAKHFHFFLVINGNPLSGHKKNILKALKNIPQMLLVTELTAKEKEPALPLLSNFELHLTALSGKLSEVKKKQTPKRAGIKKTIEIMPEKPQNP